MDWVKDTLDVSDTVAGLKRGFYPFSTSLWGPFLGTEPLDEEVHAAMEFEEASRRYLIRPGDLEPAVYVEVKDSGVLLTARILVHPRERRQVTDTISRQVLDAFAREPSVDFAYPTIRTFRA